MTPNNLAPAPNRRPRFAFDGSSGFVEHHLCAEPAASAAVCEAHR